VLTDLGLCHVVKLAAVWFWRAMLLLFTCPVAEDVVCEVHFIVRQHTPWYMSQTLRPEP
jgi:hypothetical protein